MGNAGKLKTRRITCDTFIRYKKIFNLRKESSYVLLPREQKAMSRIWRRHLFSWMRETPLKSGAICSCDKGQKTISFCLWQWFVFYLRGFLTTMTSRLDVASARWNLDQWRWSKLYAFVKKCAKKCFQVLAHAIVECYNPLLQVSINTFVALFNKTVLRFNICCA